MTSVGIFDRLFGVFFSFGNSKEAIKKKKLLYIKKIISKSRYKKFYKVSTDEALPSLASFFLQIYNGVSGYTRALTHTEKSLVLRQMVFDYFVDEEQEQILREIMPEVIEQQAARHEPAVLSDIVDGDIKKVKKSFNPAWICATDKTYNQIVLFSWLVNYDYHSLFERFERTDPDDGGNQSFKKIRARLVIENIKDFLAITGIVNADADWKAISAILKSMDESVPGIDAWLKQKDIIQDLINSEILTYIVQWTSENPDWENKVFSSNATFAEAIINNYVAETKKALHTILARDESEKINKLARQIFGSESVAYAQYYTDANNVDYRARGYFGFTSTLQFNFVLSFLFKFNESIKELANIFLVKGFWVNRAFAQDLSLAIQKINDCFQELSAFDQALSENSEDSVKLHALLTKAALGKRHKEQLERHFHEINDEARQLISETITAFTHLNTHFTNLSLEENANQHTLIRNWDELPAYKKDTDIMRLSECIGKIEDLISLILYIDTVKTDATADSGGTNEP
jgi:hypothetical protein